MSVAVGSKVPDFALASTGGEKVRLKDLLGSKAVLYFYPRDNTPGCTLEGQQFAALNSRFKKAGVTVFGISRDSVAAHEKFRDKMGYPFALLSDEDERVCKLFDVIREKNMYGRKVLGIERSTFLIDARPEQALENTLQRFEELGRGAGIGVMASIQGELPDSLQRVRERFGDAVALQIVDRRPFHDPKVLDGWQHLGVLRSEGTHEHIKHRLAAALEQLRSASRISDDAYDQALSRAPRSADAGLDSAAGEGDENPGHERSRAPENRQEALLTSPPPVMTATEREQQRGRERWLAMRAEQKAQDPSTLEERQALAREQWLEYRRTHSGDQNFGLEKDQGQEKDAEQTKDLGHENDGGID